MSVDDLQGYTRFSFTDGRMAVLAVMAAAKH
jgi:hypothetical protein